MHRANRVAGVLVLGTVWGLALGLSGCVTPREVHQFEPLPQTQVEAQDLDAVAPTPATDLLRDAQAAFENANKAQEAGDKEKALEHYSNMLELLLEANLDPGVFYNLRSEFSRILDSTEQQAGFTDRSKTGQGSGIRVAGDLPIDFPIHERILAEIDEIQRAYPKNFQAGLDRSYKYVPRIRAELTKAGLPGDLAWLAMVESQFTPKILSRAGAGGMWQFMRSTGRRYGLRCDEYVDERFNWERSTQAAIAYLTDLRDMFDGEWPLAISGYNLGEHGLKRTVASAGNETDLWKLLETSQGSRMPRETRKFYAKLMASILVARSPQEYGFKENHQPPEETVRIPIRGSYSLAAIEGACGLSDGSLRALNPDLILGVTPPDGEYKVAVPPEAAERITVALSRLSPVKSGLIPSGDNMMYVVKRGDTISGIAKRYSISSASLMRANRLRSSKLYIGKKLVIPGRSSEKECASRSTSSETASAKSFPKGQSREYTIKRGDTLLEIAKAEKVSLSDIKALNRNIDEKRLRVGDKLVLPSFSEATEKASGRREEAETFHVVKSGEYPAKIARLYGVELDDFLKWNNLSKTSRIGVGDKLVIRSHPGATGGSSSSAAQSSLKKTTYTVAKGDTASTIANRHGATTADFLKWNDLTSKSVIRIGQKVVLYVPDDSPSAPAPTPASPPKKAEPKEAEAKTSVPKTYKVASGDTVGGIAQKHGLSTKNLLEWNGLNKDSVIRVGQELKLHHDGSAPAKPKSEGETITHVVAKGQNPTTIARRYGVKVSDLYRWNDWDKNVVIRPGQKVIIHKGS